MTDYCARTVQVVAFLTCLGLAAGLLVSCWRPRTATGVPGDGYGLGQCHYAPASKPDALVGWAYDTTVPLHWRTLEPSESHFDFSQMDALVDRAGKADMQLWLSIETVGFSMENKPKAPQWLLDKGARWHYGICGNNGLIAAWDTVYQERLPGLLRAVNEHIAAQDADYRATVAGIVAMSGGMYGEMQLWSCNMKNTLEVAYSMDTASLNAAYAAAVRWLMDTYMDAFPGLPVIWHLGYSSYGDEEAVESQIVQYGARQYGDRIRYKWNGLDPVNGHDWQLASNRWYSDMFRSLAQQGIAVGYEAGHPEAYKTANAWNPAAFAEVFQWALGSRASFMCFQPEMWPGVFAAAGWQEFDAALEANAIQPEATVGKWRLFETAWTATHSGNPFLDYRLDVTFTAPGGGQFTIPGFYDGGDTWRVRFAPSEVGAWTYKASFRKGSNVAVNGNRMAGTATGFNGATGSFLVTESGAAGLLEYTGEQHLRFRDGGAFVKMGTDSPEDFLAHPFTAHGGPQGAIDYLASFGVNSIYALLMNLGGDGNNVYPFISKTDKTHYDVQKLQRWETLFTHANSKGVLLHLVLNEGEKANKQFLDNATLGTERKLYYREMVARFAHHTMLQWNLCEEYDHGVLPIPPEEINRWAAWLAGLDAYGHPITVHNVGPEPDGTLTPFTGWNPFLGNPLYGVTSLQSWASDYGAEIEKWRDLSAAASRPLPISIDEPLTATSGNAAVIRDRVLLPILGAGGNVEFILETHLSTDDFRLYEPLWLAIRDASTAITTPTPTSTPLPTDTPTATEEPTCAPTWTSTVTPSSSPTMTPSPTPTPSETPSPSPTSTRTATASPSSSATPTAANTPSPSPTAPATTTCTATPLWTETVYVALVLNDWPPRRAGVPVGRGCPGWLWFAAATGWALAVAWLTIRKLQRR
jgi:hypothetical protein